MMRELTGKTVMITGAASGIGRGTAERFAECGANVALVDMDQDNLRPAADACRSSDVHVTTHAADVTSSASVRNMMKEVIAAVDRVDSLINVAGIYPSAPLLEMSDEMWDSVLGVNLTGTFKMCRQVAPHMLERGGGSIVNISTGASMTPIVGMSAYSASKGGVNSFSRTIALELAPSVRVNVVAPGLTDTHDQASRFPELTSTVPLGRWASIGEVAEAILFLASDRASFITGQTLFVSGGRIMY